MHGSRCVVSGCMEVGVRGRKLEGLLVCFGSLELCSLYFILDMRMLAARGIGMFAFLRVVVFIVALAIAFEGFTIMSLSAVCPRYLR